MSEWGVMLQAIPILYPEGSKSTAPERGMEVSGRGRTEPEVLQSSDASFGGRGQRCALGYCLWPGAGCLGIARESKPYGFPSALGPTLAAALTLREGTERGGTEEPTPTWGERRAQTTK